MFSGNGASKWPPQAPQTCCCNESYTMTLYDRENMGIDTKDISIHYLLIYTIYIISCFLEWHFKMAAIGPTGILR